MHCCVTQQTTFHLRTLTCLHVLMPLSSSGRRQKRQPYISYFQTLKLWKWESLKITHTHSKTVYVLSSKPKRQIQWLSAWGGGEGFRTFKLSNIETFNVWNIALLICLNMSTDSHASQSQIQWLSGPTSKFGDLQMLQFPKMAISRFGNLQNLQSPELLAIFKIGNLQKLQFPQSATSRICNLHNWRSPELAMSNIGNLQNWYQSQMLAISRISNLQNCQSQKKRQSQKLVISRTCYLQNVHPP